MLNKLKALLEADTEIKDPADDVVDTFADIDPREIKSREDIRDMFLDDPQAQIIGAENDPRINEILEKIPVDDDGEEPISKKEAEELAESIIPMLNEAYESEGDAAVADRIAPNYREGSECEDCDNLDSITMF
jgi:hypothetical protein